MNTTILLVDDSPMFLELEKEYLQQSSVDIVTANDGLQALQVVKNRRPHLVFMDLQMPNMDGIACCSAIKADSTILGTPIVMITSKGDEDDRARCYAAGCDFFLTKPLDRDVFLDVARRFLPAINRREKRRPLRTEAVVRLDDATINCVLHDVGANGAFIATDHVGIPKSVVKISFAIPDGTVIDCHGWIVWLNRIVGKKPRGFGVRFALVPPKAREALKKLIESGR